MEILILIFFQLVQCPRKVIFSVQLQIKYLFQRIQYIRSGIAQLIIHPWTFCYIHILKGFYDLIRCKMCSVPVQLYFQQSVD